MDSMRQVSASHVRRLLPLPNGELPGGGPAYQRLGGALRTLILDGRIPLGTRLPAERELARTLGLSRTTTSAAYGLLRREGYLSSRRGAGSFAAFPTEPESAGLPWLGEADEGMIDLTVAAPSALPESILAAAAEAVEQLPRHLAGDGYRVLGLPELREAVAARYRRRGLPTRAEEVMITSGAQGAIALAARVFVSPGTTVLVESPTYPNALDSFRSASARLVPVPLEAGSDDAARRVELPAGAPPARLLHARLPQSDRPADATGGARLARPRRAAHGHAAARGRELPRARPGGRPARRRAACSTRSGARRLGRRPEQERVGRAPHRLGARGAVDRPAARRCQAEHGHREPAARAARGPAAARPARRAAGRAPPASGPAPGRARRRARRGAAGLDIRSPGRRALPVGGARPVEHVARRPGRASGRSNRARAALRDRRDARAVPAHPVRTPAGHAARGRVPAGRRPPRTCPDSPSCRARSATWSDGSPSSRPAREVTHSAHLRFPCVRISALPSKAGGSGPKAPGGKSRIEGSRGRCQAARARRGARRSASACRAGQQAQSPGSVRPVGRRARNDGRARTSRIASRSVAGARPRPRRRPPEAAASRPAARSCRPSIRSCACARSTMSVVAPASSARSSSRPSPAAPDASIIPLARTIATRTFDETTADGSVSGTGTHRTRHRSVPARALSRKR